MTSDNITVIMKPTNQCNLRCKYCYHADNGYDKEKMTDQVLEKAIAVTAPFFKRVEYNWHGGEPLIMGLDFYERVLYYQKKYRQGPEHHIINTMQTNGTLITQETAEFIKKYGFGIGLSFDGPFNDQTRGKTDYTLNAYDLLKQIDKRHGTISVIGAHNIHNLIDIYKYFNEKNISFKFSPMFDSGEAKNPKAKPPCFTLGQEIFISMIATSVSERISAISQYSSIVLPDIFAITFVSYSASIGIMCFAKCSTPGF